MPKKIAILKEVFLAAEWCDSFTLAEYRRQGINSKAAKHCIDYALSRGMDIIYGTPNQPNYSVAIKLGFLTCSYFSFASLSKSLTPALFTMKLIGKLILRRDTGKNYRYLKYLVKRIFGLPKGAYPYQSYHENDFHLAIIDKFNEQVDALWGEPRYLFFIYRDSSYLNWRYFENPDKYTVLAALKDEEYLGYIVLKILKDNITGVICDFVTLNDRLDVFSALVMESEEILKRKGATLVQLRCIVESPYYQTLNELGYYDHGEESYQPIVIYPKTELGKRVLDNIGRWHFTWGDSDEV
jgi:GNAT superfamily N-acetyltransferase